MARPYVTLQTENRVEEYKQEARRNLGRFLAFGDVVGILLNGGLARGYADHLSEIDITVFLSHEQYERYRRGKTPLPTGIAIIDGLLYDVKLEDYDEALATDFSMAALWDLSYAEVLYDPQGKLAHLIQEKLSQPVDVSRAERFLFEAWWNFRLAGDIWIHRGDIAQGHFVFNNAVKPLVSALFIANREYVPHDKWLIHMSRTLAWKPAGWEEKLAQAMSTGGFDKESLASRQAALAELWSAVDQKLQETLGAGVSVMQRYYYDGLRILVERSRMPLEEWQALGKGGLLNAEPFHSITRVEDGMIVLDEERVAAVQPEDMYSWFYEVVQAVRTEGLR